MTLTIENLPSELVMRLLSKDELEQLPQTEQEGIQSGLEDVDAGRVHCYEMVFARLRDLAK